MLKVDIEGAEKEIFTDSTKCNFLDITKIIAIEIHDEFGIRDDIYKVLHQYGFLIFEANETTIGINKKFISSFQNKFIL